MAAQRAATAESTDSAAPIQVDGQAHHGLTGYEHAQATAGNAEAWYHPGARAQAGRLSAKEPKPRLSRGGRWLVWGLRAVVWAALLLIGYRGVASIVTGFIRPAAPAGVSTASRNPGLTAGPDLTVTPGSFPVGLAQAYALAFTRAYLNLNPATAAQRAAVLTGFLPPGTDPQAGYNGLGIQTVDSVQVAGVTVLSAHSGIITVLASVNGRLEELAVPVYSARGGLVVPALPALLAAPTRIAPPVAATAADGAPPAGLGRFLPAFLRAFASGGQHLRAFLAPGTRVQGLGGIVGYGGVVSVTAPASSAAARVVLVTVRWRIVAPPARFSKVRPSGSSPGGFSMTYAVTVVRSGGGWRVRSVGGAAIPAGPGS